MTQSRLLPLFAALAAGTALLAAPGGAGAQQKVDGKAAQQLICSDFYSHANADWLAAHPPIAGSGLEAARRYAEIAPDAPHALHMPSHIFTRLGYWDESIETNRRSAEASPVPDAAVPDARGNLRFSRIMQPAPAEQAAS